VNRYFVVAPNTLVFLPRDFAIEIELPAKTGDN
jgi:hypothetical protein